MEIDDGSGMIAEAFGIVPGQPARPARPRALRRFVRNSIVPHSRGGGRAIAFLPFPLSHLERNTPFSLGGCSRCCAPNTLNAAPAPYAATQGVAQAQQPIIIRRIVAADGKGG